jgi:hypothetical protein
VRALRAQACAVATGDLVVVVPEHQPVDETWFARRLAGGVREQRAGDTA